MKIILAEYEDLIRELYSLELEAELDAEIVSFDNVRDVFHYLEQNHTVDLIISGHRLKDGCSEDLYSYLKERGNPIPFIFNNSSPAEFENRPIFSSFYEDHQSNRLVTKPCTADEIVDAVKKSLENLPENINSSSYYKVSIHHFLRTNIVSADIYIKLSEIKFTKLINQNELYNTTQVQSYLNKGVSYFYVHKDQFKNFSEGYSGLLRALLQRERQEGESEKVYVKSKIDIINEAISHSQSRARSIGIDNQVIQNIKEATNSAVGLIKHDHSLYNMLQGIMKKKDYLSEHSLLLSYLSGNIVIKMDWSSDSTLQKLGMAAILHDVTFKNADLAMIGQINEAKFLELRPEEQMEIKEHPQKVYDMTNRLKNFLPDVSDIILSHHERPHSMGFPRRLSVLTTSQLSCAFIIAEDFINQLWELKFEKYHIDAVLEKMNSVYNHGNYRKPLHGLLRAFGKI